jgi:hypothetical protein
VTVRYAVVVWRQNGARFGAADQVNTYLYRRRDHAERNAAAWMLFHADTVATVVEVAP